MEQVPYIITEARTRLLSKCIFFGVILYEQCQLVLLYPEDIEPGKRWQGVTTACTDGRHICVYMPFFESLAIDERVFVLAHEIYHAMAMHPRRMKYYTKNGLFGYEFSNELMQIAMDALINQCLVDDHIGSMPKDKGIIFDQGYTDPKTKKFYKRVDPLVDTPEDIYERLMNPKGGGANSGNGGSGQEMLDNAGGRGEYDPDIKEADTETDSKINEIEMKASIQSAMQQAKARGQMPGSLKTFIEEFMDPRISWEEELRSEVVAKHAKDETRWDRPHRRFIVSPGIIMPNRTSFTTGHVVISVDTSGSVSDAELQAFLSEMASILGDVRPDKVTIIWCDAAIDRIDVVDTPEELLELTRAEGINGRGGTSFVPPFEYIRDHMQDEDVAFHIYCTDMYAPFPDESLMLHPTIWLATSDIVAPFGKTIRLDISGRV